MAIAYGDLGYYEDESGSYYEDESGNRYECSLTAEELTLDSYVDLTMSLNSYVEVAGL